MKSSPGIFKVIDETELETATLCGWRLVQVVSTTVSVGSDPVVEPPAYPGAYPQTLYKNIYGPVSRYLVMKDEDSALEAARASVEEARASAASAELGVAKAQEEVKIARKEAGDLRDQLTWTKSREDTLRVRYTQIVEETQKLQEQLQAMETDLAKVRREIGDREFTRIVGK